jgi:hypothetical protein
MTLSPAEAVLAVIPGDNDDHRLILVHCHDAAGSRMELRQQTWGDGLGWFTQNSMPLLPEQVGQLRAALGAAPNGNKVKLPSANRQAKPSHLRLAHAESA